MPSNSISPEVVYDDVSGLSHGTGGAHGGGGGGGTAPTPTLVGASGGFQIDLIWDSSVNSAPSGFVQDVTQSAAYLASQFSTREIINIHVGWGEINGSSLGSGALGESETNGYLESFAKLQSQISLPIASNEPTNAQIFISSAQAKAFGVISANSTAVDGYVGFGTNVSWNFTVGDNGVGTATATSSYDLQPVIFHELTEVMGRISTEGERFNGHLTYTALDLFDFSAPNTLELSKAGGYYSNDDGITNLGNFNGSTGGGDIADWSSSTSYTQSGTGLTDGHQDAFDAFLWSGVAGDLSQSDVYLMDS